jgi:putative tryptophan/tyrosine transport system substrate-binding protein
VRRGKSRANATCPSLKLRSNAEMQFFNASTSGEIDAVFATFAREQPDALFVGADPFLNSRRLQLSLLAMRHAIPAVYANREFAEVGGLLSYGSDINDAYRQVGVYAGVFSRVPSPRTCRSCSRPS